jgi:Ser/Thr protein kinase RdoA (MazF antagonist)
MEDVASVKAYSDLANAGKLRRLRNLAMTALARYDLADSQVDYFCFNTNLHYRVTTISGERFMLRLAAPGWRTFDDLRAEQMWLAALRRETAIPVPRVIPAKSGEYVLPITAPNVPQTWNTMLMSWVPGKLLGRDLTERSLEKMGALFAELHQHGAAWNPPAGFTTRRFEHWLSRGEENVIVGAGRAVDALALRARDLLERMHQHVESAYAAIDRSDLRVIHCDLWHDNIKLYRGELYPFDFEDTVWGFRAHDIAMAMLDLLEATNDARYAVLLAAFRRGYTTHLALPAERIEPFQIGRLLWKINWVARFSPQQLTNMIERHVPVFEHYEQTGRVVRSPAVVK